ncbi:MAG: response regulator [Proteobacteria bacterium]|nr:response regulator [Pseudomonadota bacterium]MBU1711933.1 response regulator [Pseudomonadota bacterium]
MNMQERIMVIDDEKGICHNVEKILSKNNYEVICALSAAEALERMKTESFDLIISDIVMPGMNGLELLKQVKSEWPDTRALVMTAYASTDTAVKAIRLGALDYVSKPFTPDELRTVVQKAMAGDLVQAETSEKEIEMINLIDLDMPFDGDEVAKYTGEDYVKILGRSDMPVVEVKMPETLVNYCTVGDMVCDIFKKLGGTCKAGNKSHLCPQKTAKKSAGSKKMAEVPDRSKWIGIDMPFNYDEVVSVTGPEYVAHLGSEGVSFVSYQALKENVARMMGKASGDIDVDMPFDRSELAKAVGDDYVNTLGPSDMPVVEVKISEKLENYCQVGEMVCEIFKKLGATCKAGNKTSLCPQKKSQKKAKAGKQVIPDVSRLIGVDMPFVFDEVAAAVGAEYAMHLDAGEQAVYSYEEIKQHAAALMAKQESKIKRSALVIDDEVAVNNNIRKILEKRGYTVDQAISREEALEKINESSYPVIMLDLKMPGVKGLELLQSIRERRPEAMVVIITGYASIETAVETARMGAVGYLAKPFTPDEIRGAADNAARLAA